MKKKVVVIGGGFAGSHAAKHLDKHFDVTLIDTKDYFEFTPGILRTIVEPSHIRKIQVLHSHYLKWARVLVGKVKEIGKNYVLVSGRKVKFHYLVIASGSSYNLPFKEQKVVTALRAKHLRNYYERLCKADRILIIGGGLVGVELAGEILWRYGKEKEITIVHSGERLIARNSKAAINYAEKFLSDKGVKIIYNERIVNHDGKKYVTHKKKNIETDLAFLCTGITPNYSFMKKNFSEHLNARNQIKVNNHLQLIGVPNIFAIGDVGDRQEEKTAQNAERQADVIVKNICALHKEEKLREYHSKPGALLISLGKNRAIFSSKGFVIGGVFPALMKWGVERMEMMKKRKILS